MSNPFNGIISDELKTQYRNMILEVIRGFAVNCRFYYPITRFDPCTTCANAITNTNPNSFLGFNHGFGQVNKNCNVCAGSGKVGVVTYDDLSIPVIWDQKQFKNLGGNFAFASDGEVQTLSDISTSIKIIKICQYAIFDIDTEYANKGQYQRSKEPQIIGFGGNSNFILTSWTSVS